MRFVKVVMENVRNLASVDITLSPGLNHFYGSNGAGKTAVLEGIHVLSRGRSFRSPLVRDVIRTGEDQLLVRAQLSDEQRGLVSVGIRKFSNGLTELKLDGGKVQRASEVARLTPLQTLLPDVSDLVFGSPSLRRAWLDWGMFHVKRDFLAVHRDYIKVVKQRNASLRAGRSGIAELQPWNSELARLAEQLTVMRQEYLLELQPELLRFLKLLIPEVEITFEYQRGWPDGQILEKLLGERHAAEVKSGSTQWGPHRAEVRFLVTGRSAAKVLSRGQGKLLATAMKVSQVALLRGNRQRASVFLIDDAGAELDSEHGTRFFESLRQLECQVISTSVQKPSDNYGFPVSGFEMFHVKHGTIAKD